MRVIHPLKIYKEKQRKITKEKLKESYKKLWFIKILKEFLVII